MQSRCLISISFEEKEMLVYETKLIKLSRMLSMSRITQSVFFTKYCVFRICSLHFPSLVSLK